MRVKHVPISRVDPGKKRWNKSDKMHVVPVRMAKASLANVKT